MPEALIKALSNLLYGLSVGGWAWRYYTGWVKTRQAEAEQEGEQRTPQNHLRSPKGCPECAVQHGACVEHATVGEVEAWSKRKSKRGRPKVVESDGYFCNNEDCEYYGISDSSIHALVNHGWRCKREAVQYWKCEACQKVSSARRKVCAHLQLDELVTKVRGQAQRVFIWVALEAQTKIIPVIHLERRPTPMRSVLCMNSGSACRKSISPCSPLTACVPTSTPQRWGVRELLLMPMPSA